MENQTEPAAQVTEEQSQPASPAGAQNTDTQPQEHMIPKARFDEVNAELRKLQKAMADTEKQRQDAEAKALAEQGKYKELYESTLAELNDHKPYKERYEALATAQRAALTAETAKWPAEVKALLPGDDADVQTLADAVTKARKLVEALTGKTDAAKGQGQPPPPAGKAGAGAGNEAARQASVAAYYREL